MQLNGPQVNFNDLLDHTQCYDTFVYSMFSLIHSFDKVRIEGKRGRERQKERYREGGRDKRERESERDKEREIERERHREREGKEEDRE